MIAIRRARTQQSLSLNVETQHSLLSNYPSTIHYLLNVETLPSLQSNYPTGPPSSELVTTAKTVSCGLFHDDIALD